MENKNKKILVIDSMVAGEVLETEREKYLNIVLFLDDRTLNTFSSARRVAAKASQESLAERMSQQSIVGRSKSFDPYISEVFLFGHLSGMGFYCSEKILKAHGVQMPKFDDGEIYYVPTNIEESSLKGIMESDESAYTDGMSLLISGGGLAEPHFRILAKASYEEDRHQLISHSVFCCEALWDLVDEFESRLASENLGSAIQEIKAINPEKKEETVNA